jgi:GNAT superfamily N-acetyltransferase
MGNMIVREADTKDAEALARLSGELGYPSSTDSTARRLAVLLGAPANGVFVAVAGDGTVLGWIHVHARHLLESDPFAELGGLVVSSGHRGKGVGKRLLAEAENWAVHNGLNRMRIRSRSTRTDAHAFYEKAGYSVDKTQHVFDKQFGKEP